LEPDICQICSLSFVHGEDVHQPHEDVDSVQVNRQGLLDRVKMGLLFGMRNHLAGVEKNHSLKRFKKFL